MYKLQVYLKNVWHDIKKFDSKEQAKALMDAFKMADGQEFSEKYRVVEV